MRITNMINFTVIHVTMKFDFVVIRIGIARRFHLIMVDGRWLIFVTIGIMGWERGEGSSREGSGCDYGSCQLWPRLIQLLQQSEKIGRKYAAKYDFKLRFGSDVLGVLHGFLRKGEDPQMIHLCFEVLLSKEIQLSVKAMYYSLN